MRLLSALLLVLLAGLCAAQDEPVNEQDPVLVFEKRYNSAAQAVLDKNWVDAHRHFEAALAALGNRDHIRKQTAQILVKKAESESRKHRALFTANELLRLNQFKEAEEAFLAAQAELGDTAEIRQGLDNVRIRREQEPQIRALIQREKEFAMALDEAQQLQRARKLEMAREFAERARQLKPDDARAKELAREIELRLRGETPERPGIRLRENPDAKRKGNVGEDPDF